MFLLVIRVDAENKHVDFIKSRVAPEDAETCLIRHTKANSIPRNAADSLRLEKVGVDFNIFAGGPLGIRTTRKKIKL